MTWSASPGDQCRGTERRSRLAAFASRHALAPLRSWPRGLADASEDGLRAGPICALVRRLESRLRRHYGVHEFSTSPDCIMRIARDVADDAVSLADGTRIQPGEPIGVLHFWNEHLPRFPAAGPDVVWGSLMRHRLRRSLEELARYMAENEAWADVHALRGEAILASRVGRVQMARVGQRLGFEIGRPRRSWLQRLHDAGERLLAWGMILAFNPEGLRSPGLHRRRYELWMSRQVLQSRYGRDRPSAGPPPTQTTPTAAQAAQ